MSFLVASFQCQSSTWFVRVERRTAACRAGSCRWRWRAPARPDAELAASSGAACGTCELLQQRGDVGAQRRVVGFEHRQQRAVDERMHECDGGDAVRRGGRGSVSRASASSAALTPIWPVAARSLRAIVRTSARWIGQLRDERGDALRVVVRGVGGGHAGVGELRRLRGQAPWRGPAAACRASRTR